MKIKNYNIIIIILLWGCDPSDDNGTINPSPILGCTNSESCNYNASATEDDGSCAFEDECGICGGDGSSCSPNLDDGKWEIYYSSDIDFGGFQFKISNVVITGSSGGAAAEAGFTVSNGNDTVLGFSLSGAIIPKGSGVLTIVDIDGDETQACINNVVISDISGYSLSYTIDSCNTIIIQ